MGPTDEQLLRAIMPGSPTAAEVEAKLTTADLLCGLDSDVVEAIWADLDREQFEFQEFVFQVRCPRNNTFLLGLQEARRDAGVATTTTTTTGSSTTSARSTTTRSTTTRPATTRAASDG